MNEEKRETESFFITTGEAAGDFVHYYCAYCGKYLGRESYHVYYRRITQDKDYTRNVVCDCEHAKYELLTKEKIKKLEEEIEDLKDNYQNNINEEVENEVRFQKELENLKKKYGKTTCDE